MATAVAQQTKSCRICSSYVFLLTFSLENLQRVELKSLRTQDAKQRIVWSKKHGHDTYGEEIKGEATQTVKKKKAKSKRASILSKVLDVC